MPDGGSGRAGHADQSVDVPNWARELAAPRPRLRGVLHQWGFFVSLPLAAVLVGLVARGGVERIAALAYGTSVVTMFGASALYHRVTWSPSARRWLRRLDHSMIYCLIAGTYTPFGLLVLDGAWRVAILAIVWSGAVLAICLKVFWVDAPKWLAAVIGIGLGWVGVVVMPQIFDRIGVPGAMLLLAGGVAYTAGGIVYACRRPDPVTDVFGYHEVFHALVIVAVACQYAAVALFVL
jgi:hemolysin III